MTPLIILCMILAPPGVLLWRLRASRKAYLLAARNRPDLDVVDAGSWSRFARCVLEQQQMQVTFWPDTDSGGGRRTRVWRLIVGDLRLARRTTLWVSEANLLARLASGLGFHDVQVGDKIFDDTFYVAGSEPDVVRGVLREDAVRRAVARLFYDHATMHIKLDEDGQLQVLTRRSAEQSVGHGTARATAVATLARALEDAHEVPAQPAPTLSRGSGSSSSGAPVGVPLLHG